MRNTLLVCVKHVKNLRKIEGIVCERFSTGIHQDLHMVVNMWVNTPTFTQTVYTFYTVVSTRKIHTSSLLNGRLSPLSTWPITDTTFYKKGEI